jgi:hypothetical protein
LLTRGLPRHSRTSSGLLCPAWLRYDWRGRPLYSGVNGVPKLMVSGTNFVGCLWFFIRDPIHRNSRRSVFFNDEASSRVHSCSSVQSSRNPSLADGWPSLGALPLASHPAVTSDAWRDQRQSWTLSWQAKPALNQAISHRNETFKYPSFVAPSE